MILQSEPELLSGYPKLLPTLDMMHILPVRAIVRPADLVQMNAASERIDSVLTVNYDLDLHISCTG